MPSQEDLIRLYTEKIHHIEDQIKNIEAHIRQLDARGRILMPDQTIPVPVCPWSEGIYEYIITWQVNWDSTIP